LNQKADPSRHPGRESCAGADVGASLAKLVVRDADGSLHFRLVPSHAIEQVAREVEELRPSRLGLTGGGAARLAGRLSLDTARVGEFDAWRLGARALLARQGEPQGERDLLVSLGTGTALLLATDDEARWVGGIALGGGTLLGLGGLLLGSSDFDEVVALAARGDRRRVDLLVGDIYGDAPLPLPAEINASSFAKLARPGARAEVEPADLAGALMGLVGESVAGLCAATARATAAERIVFGGATLRRNAPLREILGRLALLGRPVVFLEEGEFSGAMGALLASGAQP
jgi:type II pantothenate kinase